MQLNIKHTILFIFGLSFLLCQDRVVLNRNDSHFQTFQTFNSGEFLLHLDASSYTNWSVEDDESSVLTIFVNEEYNQDIVLYYGLDNHTYKQSLGFLGEGSHFIEVFFDYEKSSNGATVVYLNNLDFIDTSSLNISPDIFKYSPILYGRNIFEWNESNHTDIPLLMYYKINEITDFFDDLLSTVITYNIIFSNEDSRVGIGLSDMMLSWGRTTDIEWVYEVTLDENGEIVDEIFQGASHTPTTFNGDKLGTHPILINATPNCNFDDNGTSDYKFFLSPANTLSENHTSEYLMDQNPWTYRIMGEELLNEDKYESIQDPTHWEMSDIRNYLYIEYDGNVSGENVECKIQTTLYDDCYFYSNDHNSEQIVAGFGNGIHRTAIELPENFNPENLQYLHFKSSGDSDYNIFINEIIQIFYLNENYEMTFFNTSNMINNIQLNNANPDASILLNDSFLDFDCTGELYGNAFCDDCNICASGNSNNIPNEDMDDCGVCFGENQALDCNGVCFGGATLDECNVCDDIEENNGDTCSGCIDFNADNYNPEALYFDNSCIYSDNIFHVPEEYSLITYALFFASTGDTVLVQPGTYYEELDFDGKGIALLSTLGPENTIIEANTENGDGGGVYEPDKSVITIKDTGNNEVVIDGFTITNGYGKGVNFEYFVSVAADPDMFNDMMYNSIKSGGISSINSSITLSNLIVHNNTSKNVAGGIGLVNTNAVIDNVLIENNHVEDIDGLGGGGIAVNGGTTQINNSIIRNNTVGLNMYQLNGGGGILCGFDFNDDPLELFVFNTEIYNNTSNIGAAIGALSGNINLDQLLIYQNNGDYGSAISLGEPLGLVVDDINMIITNSTITNNNGVIALGMIDNSTLTLANTILWNNGVFEITSLPNNSTLNTNIFYSDVRILENLEIMNSFSQDPLFENVSENNYTLTQNSPCIDTGTNSLEFNGNIIIDIEMSEYSGIMPDIGYFEFENDILHGDINLDNTINILDIVILINFILGGELEYGFSIQATDMNQDGVVNVLDVVLLINIVLNY